VTGAEYTEEIVFRHVWLLPNESVEKVEFSHSKEEGGSCNQAFVLMQDPQFIYTLLCFLLGTNPASGAARAVRGSAA
jgi:hypothetical protein